MSTTPFTKGLHQIGNGLYAYLQPTGGWGYSNAGLLVDGDANLLVDTLFDKKLTAEMLDQMARATKAAAHIQAVVNTHANGDHCWGNELVQDARIIASEACAREMEELGPGKMAMLVAAARLGVAFGPLTQAAGHVANRVGLRKAAAMFHSVPLVERAFAPFDFSDTRTVYPTETFRGELVLNVGGRRVELIEVGPAHTRGDVLVHVPDARVVFTGDVLFANVHPVVWAGPIANWLKACERILSLKPDIVVPGHGPITDCKGVERMATYLRELHAQATLHFKAGLTVEQAALALKLPDCDDWIDSERLAANVLSVYKELRGESTRVDPITGFGAMARFAAVRSSR